MKILATAAGPEPARSKVGYIMDIAKRLGAEVVALHISREENTTQGEETLKIFTNAGQNTNVNVIKILKRGDVVSNIIETADNESVNLIMMGASPGKAAEWMSTGVMENAKVPVVVIPNEYRGTS